MHRNIFIQNRIQPTKLTIMVTDFVIVHSSSHNRPKHIFSAMFIQIRVPSHSVYSNSFIDKQVHDRNIQIKHVKYQLKFTLLMQYF